MRRLATCWLTLVIAVSASSFEQSPPKHVLGNADVSGSLHFDQELVKIALGEERWFRLSVRHEQEVLPSGKAISNFGVPQLRAFAHELGPEEIQLLLPGWSRPSTITLADDGNGAVSAKLNENGILKVDTRNGWSYEFEKGSLVRASGGRFLDLAFESDGLRISTIHIESRGRRKLLCQATYDKAGLLVGLKYASKSLLFERDAAGQLNRIREMTQLETLFEATYEDGLVAQLEAEGMKEKLSLEWKAYPSHRGDFFKRGRKILKSDGRFEYEFKVADGVVFQAAIADEEESRLWFNPLTGKSRRETE